MAIKYSHRTPIETFRGMSCSGIFVHIPLRGSQNRTSESDTPFRHRIIVACSIYLSEIAFDPSAQLMTLLLRTVNRNCDWQGGHGGRRKSTILGHQNDLIQMPRSAVGSERG